jgi:ATP-dependent Clp protease ATP-binding subunit ClpC
MQDPAGGKRGLVARPSLPHCPRGIGGEGWARLEIVTSFLFLVALGISFLIYRSRRSRPAPPAPAPATQVQVAPADVETATLADRLQGLAQRLDAFAEQTTHPRELLNSDDFKAAVALLADPACELETVRHYAVGRLWIPASAAFEALRGRPDRQQMLVPAMAQLRTYSPGLLHFVLRYFAALRTRPAPGAPALIAQPWWAGHSMLIESFREHFETRQAMGDAASFGPENDLSGASVEREAVEAFVGAVDHPFSAALIAELRQARSDSVNERELTVYGRFWKDADAELLVEPASWTEALDACERAVLATPPRSVLVTGGPRMGKSSFLRLLGARMAGAGWRVYEASAADLMADQFYIGQIEGRVRKTVEELQAGKRVAWCVGDIAQLAGSGTHRGQAASLLDQIWPAVAAGRLLLLAEATAEGASRTLQSHPSLRMGLELVRLNPFDERQLGTLAEDVASRLSERRPVVIGPEAIQAALHYAQQYLGAGDAPGVVADVLKRAAERALAAGGADGSKSEVRAAHIVEAVSQMTGLPASILGDDEPIELAAVRGYFAERVIGQDEAIGAVVDRIAMLKAGLVDTTKPIGVFLFAGPTGTGKTELAKTLAEFLFGAPERLVRLDMSEFQTPDAVAKVVGERGQAGVGDPLVERIRKQPFSVVLLDEFEKAHVNIWDLFLQVFDDGRLTDANGLTADLRHTIIILTSNLGAASHVGPGIGFARKEDVFTEHQVLMAVERAFRPEFINRLDRIVVFKPLSRELMYRILRKELAAVLDRRGLKSRDWAVEWEPSALDFLIDKGFSPSMGARPLKRAIDQYLLAPLAATLVEHRFPEGDQFLFVRASGKVLEVEFLDPYATIEPPAPASAPTPVTAGGFSLPELILRPSGDAAAGAWLAERAQALQAQLEGAQWTELKARLGAQAADPDIWGSASRVQVFSGLNLIDRVGEAARTAGRLAGRLRSGQPAADKASRDMVARLALQLYLTEAGLSDAIAGAPVDAVLAVEPALEAGAEPSAAWRERIMAMYRAWAERRRMQVEVIAPPPGAALGTLPLLYVSGFGAWRTLAGERGLHLLEHPAGAPQRREAVRVRVIAGPDEEIPVARLHAELATRLAAAPAAVGVVRRYREHPSPLVRDTASGGRSGNIEAVLGGDFDLVFG